MICSNGREKYLILAPQMVTWPGKVGGKSDWTFISIFSSPILPVFFNFTEVNCSVALTLLVFANCRIYSNGVGIFLPTTSLALNGKLKLPSPCYAGSSWYLQKCAVMDLLALLLFCSCNHQKTGAVVMPDNQSTMLFLWLWRISLPAPHNQLVQHTYLGKG